MKTNGLIRKLHIVMLLVLLFSCDVLSQISIVNTSTPSQLVNNVLMGNGVTAFNVTYNNSSALANNPQSNVVYFNQNGTTFPFLEGVLISTGNANDAVGPNSSGSSSGGGTSSVSFDQDLQDIAAGSVNNGAVLEFDFIPTGDSISFQYLFGSDEYPEFANSSFNDAFGFFISGPGFNGPFENNAVNIALIPGTSTPVTINNVNAVNNAMFYRNNVGGAQYGNAIEYDGTTVVLTAFAQVQCNQMYHVKIAISNVGDSGYDSGVFIQANSFVSEAVQIELITADGDSTIVEGCTQAQLVFTRPASQLGDSLFVDYSLTGSAQEGLDYNNFPNPIVFLPGQDSIVVVINPIQDNVLEGQETLVFNATVVSGCGDSTNVTQTVLINESNINVTANDVVTYCSTDTILLSATATNGFEPYSYSWSVSSVNNDTVVATLGNIGSQAVIVIVTDQCGFTGADTVDVSQLQSLSIDSILTTETGSCNSMGTAQAFFSGNSSGVTMFWEDLSTGQMVGTSSSVTGLGVGNYLFSITDGTCTLSDTFQISQAVAPNANFNLLDTVGCAELNVITNNTSNGQLTFQWLVNSIPISSSTNINYLVNQVGTYEFTLVATDSYNCSDSTSKNITVLEEPIAEFSATNVCEFETIQLVNESSYSNPNDLNFSWEFQNQFSNEFEPTGFQSAFGIHTIQLSVTAANGCFDSIYKNVQIYANPLANFDVTDVCIGNSINAISNSTIPNDGLGSTLQQFSWDFGDGNVSNGVSTSHLYTNPDTYLIELTVTTNFGCTANASDSITIFALPLFNVLGTNMTGCSPICPELTLVNLNSSVAFSTVTWTSNAFNLINGLSVSAPCLENNSSSSLFYDLFVEVISTNGCSSQVNLTDYFEIYPLPIANFTFQPTNPNSNDEQLLLDNVSVGGSSYDWTFLNGNSNDFEPIIQFDSTFTSLSIELIVTSNFGCVDTLIKLIPIEQVLTYYVPNAFTPDGDEYNNTFYPIISQNIDVENFTFLIFNRWGEVVFESRDPKGGWDGTYQGKLVQSGTYTWKMIIKENNKSNAIEAHGHVTILR